MELTVNEEKIYHLSRMLPSQ